jgi:hypothetical protein
MGDEAEYLDDAGDYYAHQDHEARERAAATKPGRAITHKPKGEIPMSDKNSTAMAVVEGNASILPRNIEAQITEAVQMRNALNRLFEGLLEIGKDYDRIPGTDKPTLLKPGAEILCMVFKLAQGQTDMLDKSEDWENGVFSYTIGQPLIHKETGHLIAYGTGAANSMEKKHRYRSQEVDGKKVQIQNPDPADLQNTLIKMAKKRALVDAVLAATGASRFFTQDMEEFGAMTGQFEKASSNQIGFIKKLYGNMAHADAIADVSALLGRELKTFEDIYRSEASRVIDAKKGNSGGGSYSSAPPQGNNAPSPGDGTPLACVDCGSVINQAEHNFSNNKFGRPLCRSCQNKAKGA